MRDNTPRTRKHTSPSAVATHKRATSTKDTQQREAMLLVRKAYDWCGRCQRWVPKGWECMHYGWK